MKRKNLNSDYALINSLNNKDLMIFCNALSLAVDIELILKEQLSSNAK